MQETSCFDPGSRIDIPASVRSKPRRLYCSGRTDVRVAVPSRLVPVIFDFRYLVAGATSPAGTGGISYAFDAVMTTLRLSVTDRAGELSFESRPIPELVHFHRVFTSLTELPGLRVGVDREAGRHQGFGSTAAQITGFCAGVNELLSRAFSENELLQLIGHNYVEQVGDSSRVTLGLSFGGAAASALFGGVVCMAPRYGVLAQMPLPESMRIIAYTPHERFFDYRMRGATAAEERVTLNQEALDCEAAHAQRKLRILDEQLLPALRAGDFEHHLQACWRMIQSMLWVYGAYNGPRYVEHLERLHRLGAVCPSRSASGPTTFFLCTRDDAQDWVSYLLENELCHETPRVGTSRGLEVT